MLVLNVIADGFGLVQFAVVAVTMMWVAYWGM